jgi:hypothetical protein
MLKYYSRVLLILAIFMLHNIIEVITWEHYLPFKLYKELKLQMLNILMVILI